MRKFKVMSVFGTRPEAIKMAPLVRELAARPQIESLCCVTGQHREMLRSVMETFQLQANYDLDIMEPQQTLTSITTKTIQGMDNVLEQCSPDLILVHADSTNMQPVFDEYSAIVYAMNSKNVRSSMVNGEWIMRNRMLCHLNKEETLEDIRRLSRLVKL